MRDLLIERLINNERGMARPVQADAEATRQRILDEAVGLFSAHGVAGASIRQIAASAGVSVGMIHHYFGSKDGLYDACIAAMDAELASLQGPLLAAMAAGDAGRALPVLLADAVRAGFRLAREHATALRLLQREILAQGALRPERQRGMQIPFLALAPQLAGVLGRPPASVRLSLQSIVMLISRYALSSDAELALFVPDHPDPPEAVADHLVELSLRLLGLEPTP